MKKFSLIPYSVLSILALGLTLSSCTDDDPEPKKVLSFTASSKTVQESVGTVNVTVELSAAAPKDLVIQYDLSGTATEKAGIASGDYEILSDAGEVHIAKGETMGTIEISVVADVGYEANETVILELREVNSTDIDISSEKGEMEITITNDDPKPVASLNAEPMTVNEADGTELLELEVVLDQVAPEDITVDYTLTGTAWDSTWAYNEEIPPRYYDYYIHGQSGKVTVEKGETTAKIQIRVLTDFRMEDPETIIVTLKDSDNAAAGNDKTTTITLEQEDGMLIQLGWDYTTVDMDLALWVGQDVPSLDLFTLSAFDNLDPEDPTSFEQLFIPHIFIDGTQFGLSYIYYAGDKDEMDFEVLFIEVIDGEVEPQEDWSATNGTYTLANINEWENAGDITHVAQTFEYLDGAFTNFSALDVPETGSRVAARKPTNKTFHRTKGNNNLIDFRK